MNTRLAVYSKVYKNGKTSAKAIREAYKAGTPMDLEITDMMSPDCGRYTSPDELKRIGQRSVWIRFNQDRSVMELKLS